MIAEITILIIGIIGILLTYILTNDIKESEINDIKESEINDEYIRRLAIENQIYKKLVDEMRANLESEEIYKFKEDIKK